jgi:hypothetical protein
VEINNLSHTDDIMLLYAVSRKSHKSKPKYTQANLKRWAQALVEENRRRKRAGDPRLSLDEYINKIHGILTPAAPTKTEAYVEPQSYAVQRSQEIKKYRSLVSDQITNCERKEPIQYSGERTLLGIAVMHKSNMVPVFDAESAKDIAQMRRN